MFSIVSDNFKTCVHATMTLTFKVDEFVLQATNTVEELAYNFYSDYESEPRCIQTIGPMISVSSDGFCSFMRGLQHFSLRIALFHMILV